MIQKQFDQLTYDDVLQLIQNQVMESRTIEYKMELNSGSDSEKKELLADIASFANSGGGDILYGVKEIGGYPAEIMGIDIDDEDSFLLRMESIIRDGILPRLSTVRTKIMSIDGSRKLLVVRIRPSPSGPHQVVFKGSSKFWARSTNGKYEMDVNEIRDAFLYSDRVSRYVRQIHEEFILKCRGNKVSFLVENCPQAVISIIPSSFINSMGGLETSMANAVPPVRTLGYSSLQTIEGSILYSSSNHQEGAVSSFTISYRKGGVSAMWPIGRIGANFNGIEKRVIWMDAFEDGLVEIFDNAKNFLSKNEIDGPYYLGVSIIKCEGFSISFNSYETSRSAWMDEAILSDRMIDVVMDTELLDAMCNFPRFFGFERPANRPLRRV